MKIEKTLRGQALFSALSAEEVSRISSSSAVKHYSEGEPIHLNAVQVSHVFLCLSGSVHLLLPAQTRQLTLVVGKGELFGVAALLGHDRYTTAAVAAEPTEVLAMEARPLQQILQENPRASLEFTRRAALVYYTRYLELMKAFRALQTAVTGVGLIHS